MSTTFKQWYALNTHLKAERKVCILLNKKSIETFYPITKVLKEMGEKNKVLYQPLFSNCVFVYACENDFEEIKSTEGVKNLVYWLARPAIIKSEEIEVLKNVINDYQNIQLEKIHVGSNVQMTESELRSDSTDSHFDDKKPLIKFSLPSIGYAIVGEAKSFESKIINIKSLNHGKSRRAVI